METVFVNETLNANKKTNVFLKV